MAVIAGARTFHQIRATVRAGFLPVMKVSWITSPLCLAFAQKFLPEQTWVPFFNIVAFVIGTYINAHTKKKRLAALRRKVRYCSPLYNTYTNLHPSTMAMVEAHRSGKRITKGAIIRFSEASPEHIGIGLEQNKPDQCNVPKSCTCGNFISLLHCSYRILIEFFDESSLRANHLQDIQPNTRLPTGVYARSMSFVLTSNHKRTATANAAHARILYTRASMPVCAPNMASCRISLRYMYCIEDGERTARLIRVIMSLLCLTSP